MSDRKVILKMVMSLDGFVTSTDGTHEWMFEWFGDDSGEWNRRALEEAGVHAMGRRSYEIMGPHWAASEGPIATAMNEKPKAVFSHTLTKAEMGTSRDLRRRPARGDRGPEGSGRRRNGPGPRRPRLRQVADPPGPRRRIPADDGPDRYRRGPQPIRGAGRAPEAGRRRRGALLERRPCADSGAEAIATLARSPTTRNEGRTRLSSERMQLELAPTAQQPPGNSVKHLIGAASSERPRQDLILSAASRAKQQRGALDGRCR